MPTNPNHNDEILELPDGPCSSYQAYLNKALEDKRDGFLDGRVTLAEFVTFLTLVFKQRYRSLDPGKVEERIQAYFASVWPG